MTSTYQQQEKNNKIASQEKENADRRYFQNLFPGKKNSSFIDAYTKCLENKPDTLESKQLLTNSPPVLSFPNDAKTRLYEKFPPPNPRGADRGAHSLNYAVV